MKSLIALLIGLLAVGLFAEDVKWMGFNEGVAQVKAKKKPAVVDFYTDWCGWCKTMDQKTYGDPVVRAKLKKRYITMKINPETSKEIIQYDGKQLKAMELASGLGVQGFPATAFMDAEGKFVTMLPVFIPPETFIQLLNYIDDECYKKQVSFEDYQKKNDGPCKPAKK